MSKKVINVLVHTVLMVAIFMLFLPFLKSSDDGYNGAKVVEQPKVTESKVETPVETAVEQAPVELVVEQAEQVVEEVTSTVTDVIADVEVAVGVEDENESALYSVVDGNKLDEHSYAGFKLYRNWCARCHGTYGQGMVGPNLADSLKVITEKEFFHTVENGKAGSIGSMPSWKANVKVMEGRDQLYAYLMARSDGAIGEVKPKKQ